jgi:four helix bundle protein
MARASLSEVETQLTICERLHMIPEDKVAELVECIDELAPKLQAFINAVSKRC